MKPPPTTTARSAVRAVEIRARNAERAWRRSRRDQELSVPEGSLGSPDHAPLRIDRRRGHTEQELDAAVAVERFVLRVGWADLAAQVPLRQRRAVVGKVRLGRHEGDPADAVGVAVRLDRTRGGQAPAGDHELEAVHRSSSGRGRG